MSRSRKDVANASNTRALRLDGMALTSRYTALRRDGGHSTCLTGKTRKSKLQIL